MLQRLKEYLDYKNIKIATFEKSVGMSNASLSKHLRKGGNIGADKLKAIHEVYPELNMLWLITGNGEMINETGNKKTYVSVEKEQLMSDVPQAEYKKRIAFYEETIGNLNNYILKNKEELKEKDKQLQEKELRINELLKMLYNSQD